VLNNRVLIVGATSDIAQATARQFASRGFHLALAGRNLEDLKHLARDLEIRYDIACMVFPFEAVHYETHAALLEQVETQFGTLDGILTCHGYLGNQQVGQTQVGEALKIIEVNLLSCVSLLNAAAARFEQRKSGFICAISSVAGDRGRQSNYLYGTAKGGLTIYLQGLRNRLAKSGVDVITVKPGFVDTKMTYGMDGMFLVAKPDKMAAGIYRAIVKRKNTVYLPRFWRLIMWIIRHIPEPVFKRMSL